MVWSGVGDVEMVVDAVTVESARLMRESQADWATALCAVRDRRGDFFDFLFGGGGVKKKPDGGSGDESGGLMEESIARAFDTT